VRREDTPPEASVGMSIASSVDVAEADEGGCRSAAAMAGGGREAIQSSVYSSGGDAIIAS
jgi:hypothetical protein